MRSGRVEHGSFRARSDELVALFGLASSPMRQSPAEPATAVVGLRGSVAYRINQYLFDGRATKARLTFVSEAPKSSSDC